MKISNDEVDYVRVSSIKDLLSLILKVDGFKEDLKHRIKYR